MKETKFDLDIKKSEFPSSAEDSADSAKKIGGIRVGHLNIILIAAGLVVALLMVLSMFQTSDNFSQIVDVTDDYLTTQSTAGMLSDMSGRLAEQATAFVQGGPPDLTHAWNGQYATIVVQLDSYEKEVNNTMEDEFLGNAIRAFRANSAAELKAMRLAADPLPNSQLTDRLNAPGWHTHHDPFKDVHPNTSWRECLEHAEKIGLGTREYELVRM